MLKQRLQQFFMLALITLGLSLATQEKSFAQSNTPDYQKLIYGKWHIDFTTRTKDNDYVGFESVEEYFPNNTSIEVGQHIFNLNNDGKRVVSVVDIQNAYEWRIEGNTLINRKYDIQIKLKSVDIDGISLSASSQEFKEMEKTYVSILKKRLGNTNRFQIIHIDSKFMTLSSVSSKGEESAMVYQKTTKSFSQYLNQ